MVKAFNKARQPLLCASEPSQILFFGAKLFQIEKRVENRIQKWQKGVEEELRKQQEAAMFKARPAKVLYQEPFRPEHHDKPMTEISNFELHSDRRAREREAFELEKKRKEADLESMKRQVREKTWRKRRACSPRFY